MREILFRGKRIDGLGWVFGDLLTDYIHHEGWTIVHGGCVYFEVDPATVGQYTGLKDKHGVEIYEGDITRHHRHGDTTCWVWHERHICFVGKPFEGDISERYYYQKLDEPDLEVIGKMHDNPELLEAT